MNEEKELHFPTVEETIKSFEPKEKTMTTKELADTLNVSNMAISRVLEKTNNLNGTVKVENGKVTCFTENQATLIKQEIQKHHNLATRKIDDVSSNIEVIENFKNATEKLVAMLNVENQKLQSQVATLKPQAQIANDFIDRNHLTNFRDTSNILGITQKDLMQILFPKYIYKNSVGEYRCYAKYSKYFSLRPFQKGIEKTGQQLMLTLDGLEFFKSECEVEK